MGTNITAILNKSNSKGSFFLNGINYGCKAWKERNLGAPAELWTLLRHLRSRRRDQGEIQGRPPHRISYVRAVLAVLLICAYATVVGGATSTLPRSLRRNSTANSPSFVPPSLPRYGPDSLCAQVETALMKIIGVKPHFFRPVRSFPRPASAS